MNDIKSIIQKEEYIAIAINKYILQTAKIPKKLNGTVYELDWEKLLTNEYLGTSFNKYNPLTKEDIVVTFDTSNNAYIKGVITSTGDDSEYNEKYNFLYNFYINKIFRVNTLSPTDITKTTLYNGSKVIYNDIQKDIALEISKADTDTTKKEIFLVNAQCTSGKEFYELNNNKLIKKYCKTDGTSFEIYQKSPVYVENLNDLQYIKSDIGAKAYVLKNNFWYEYYFQGNSSPYWIPTGDGSVLTVVDETLTLEQRILSYIPSAKDLLIRNDGGCMLANGDIFCWGDNSYKKAGVENYGQLDSTLSADYINTPVMLKVQTANTIPGSTIDDTLTTNKWYNSPYRIKFEKIGMNSKNVCGISPYYESLGVGGDLYCNGLINSANFEDLSISGDNETSILKKNIHFYTDNTDTDTTNNKFLKDIAMVNDVIAVLTSSGDIYTIGTNKKGALGIGSDIETYSNSIPQKIYLENTSIKFKKLLALRDTRTFGALDTNNQFWMWGERSDYILNAPTKIASTTFNSDYIFVNPNEFILKGLNGTYYRTYDNNKVISTVATSIPTTAISATYYNYNGTPITGWITENMQLGNDAWGSYIKKCINFNGTSYTLCENDSSDKEIFDKSFNKLNDATNRVNGANYGNFSNISIFTSKTYAQGTTTTYPTSYTDNFNTGNYAGWNSTLGYPSLSYSNTYIDNFPIYNDGINTYYGRIGTYYDNGTKYIALNDGTQEFYKIFDFGADKAGQTVYVQFDIYGFTYNSSSHPHDYNYNIFLNNVETTIPNIVTTTYSTTGYNPVPSYARQFHYNFQATLDSSGKLKLGLGSDLQNIGVYNDIVNYNWGFDNISVSLSSTSSTTTNTITSIYAENFENNSTTGWGGNGVKIYDGGTVGTKFLGRFSRDSINTTVANAGAQEVYKTFNLGSAYANQTVRVTFDMYEIDSWDASYYQYELEPFPSGVSESFFVYINDKKVAKDIYAYDTTESGYEQWFYADTRQGIDIGEISGTTNFSYANDEKHTYTFIVTLDSIGSFKLGFGAILGEGLGSESFGIDNIYITQPEKYFFINAGYYTEDFEDSSTYGWNKTNLTTALTGTKFLGPFGKENYTVNGVTITKGNITTDGSEQVSKTYSFGSAYANKQVNVKFDMYELETWDGVANDGSSSNPEAFFVYINGSLITKDTYGRDEYDPYIGKDTKEGTEADLINTNYYTSKDEIHRYTIVTNLDSNGDLKLGFGAKLGENIDNESFGIDNIEIDANNFENNNFESSTASWTNGNIYSPSVGTATKFLGLYNRYNDTRQDVYKTFDFGTSNANKTITIDFDFYKIDNWYNGGYYGLVYYGDDKFYFFLNDTRNTIFEEGTATTTESNYLKRNRGGYLGNINNSTYDDNYTYDVKYHYHYDAKLDSNGRVKLGFGANMAYSTIDLLNWAGSRYNRYWGVDNVKVIVDETFVNLTEILDPPSTSDPTVTSSIPFICTMAGLGTESQMYCWSNVGRSIPILSTSLYDMSKISNLNKLFITQEAEKNTRMSYTKYDNNGKLFLKFPTYIGGFDYPFYFK